MQEWLTMTACDLGRGIGMGQIDPVDLTETYLSAIDAHPHRDRIYARVTHDRAGPRRRPQKTAPLWVCAGPCWMVFRSVGRTSLIRPVSAPRLDRPC